MEPNEQQEQLDQVSERESMLKNKKFLIAVGVGIAIFIVAAIFLFTTLLNKQSIENSQPKISLAEKAFVKPNAILHFDNPAIRTQSGVPVSTNININTDGEFITRAVISIKFDPSVVSNVSIEQVSDPDSAISNAFEDTTGEVNIEEGIAWITLEMAESTPPQAGSGAVAKITFTPSTSTTLNFGGNSAFTSRLVEEPILVNAPPLEIIISGLAPGTQEGLPL